MGITKVHLPSGYSWETLNNNITNDMTYRSRGRGILEIAVAVTFVGFLAGFVTVLLIRHVLGG